MITVYTVMTGDYDEIQPQVREKGVTYLCFTDSRDPLPEPWVRMPLFYHNGTTAKASRKPKLQVGIFVNSGHSIYMDATCTMKISPSEAVGRWLKDADMALFRHPWRDCAYQEAQECININKAPRELIEAQVSAYRQEGFPDRFGLFACGVILRRHTPEVTAINDLWWKQVEQFSHRDQISLPYVLWKLKSPIPIVIPGHCYENEWFVHGGHRR
jgi:hypothetical protein